jgi:hypothetical protein
MPDIRLSLEETCMPETPASIAERMAREGQKTLEFFKALTPEQMLAPIYSEGSVWAVRDVLAHFVSAESGITRLIENILAGGSGTPEDFDLDTYNERKVASLREASADDLLGQFETLREISVSLVRRLQQADLAITGRHPWLGVATIEDILKIIYRHNHIHQRDIRRALNSAGQSENG